MFTACTDDSSCHHNGYCHLGQCHCQPGYQGDGATACNDVDECLLGYCDVNAHCQNSDGGYNCSCNDGYEGNGQSCVGKMHRMPEVFLINV